MKLIKLTNEHYIICDDSEIKEVNICCNLAHSVIVKPTDLYWANSNKENLKVITHSTQPVEYSPKIGKYWNNVQPLSLSEVKELLGEVDVEKKADEFCDRYFTEKGKLISVAYKSGYREALEDNKGNVYTEEDMRKAISETRKGMLYNKHYEDEYIQFLQPPTSWDVIFEQGKLKLIEIVKNK